MAISLHSHLIVDLKIVSPHLERGRVGRVEQTLENADPKQVYESACAQAPAES